MNTLDKISAILGISDIKLGFLPDEPDTVTALFEYSAEPLEHSFERSDCTVGVQVRTRSFDTGEAYSLAENAVGILNRYHDREISIIQDTPILDIGRDTKQRQEYAVNFKIRRY